MWGRSPTPYSAPCSARLDTSPSPSPSARRRVGVSGIAIVSSLPILSPPSPPRHRPQPPLRLSQQPLDPFTSRPIHSKAIQRFPLGFIEVNGSRSFAWTGQHG